MTVNKERVELWAQALESEKYVQCHGAMKLEPGEKSPYLGESPILLNQVRHCVLGVAEEVARLNDLQVPFASTSGVWPDAVIEWYGFDDPDPLLVIEGEEYEGGGTFSVSYINDVHRLPFWDIAQLIRATYLKDDDVHGH
jgi:hypothetical protein